jgi:hypothetical protein
MDFSASARSMPLACAVVVRNSLSIMSLNTNTAEL